MIENEQQLTNYVVTFSGKPPEGESWRVDLSKTGGVVEMESKKVVNQDETGETGETGE